eukprot:403366665
MEVGNNFKLMHYVNSEAGDHSIIIIMENLTRIGQEIIEICKFIELNVTAIRKILKKFDKQFKGFAVPYASYFLTKSLSEDENPFRIILDNTQLLVAFETFQQCILDLKSIVNRRKIGMGNPSLKKQKSQGTQHNDSKLSQQFREPLLLSVKSGLDQDDNDKITLAEDQKKSMKQLLNSQNSAKLLRSKLSILESTLTIIDEALLSLKYTSSYAIKLNQRLKTSQYEKDLKIQSDYVKPMGMNLPSYRQKQMIENESLAYRALTRKDSSPFEKSGQIVHQSFRETHLQPVLFLIFNKIQNKWIFIPATVSYVIIFHGRPYSTLLLGSYFSKTLLYKCWVRILNFQSYQTCCDVLWNMFQEPMKENANFANFHIEFAFAKKDKQSSESYPFDKSIMDFWNKPFILALIILGFSFSEKFTFLMAAPITYPEHILRWFPEGSAFFAETFKGKLYSSYLMVLLLAFLLILLIINCSKSYNERRILASALILNLLSVIGFADFQTSKEFDQTKYLIAFTMISLTNILMESATVTFLMKNLAHYITSTSIVMNAGFLIEMVEVASKVFTILVIMLGLMFEKQYLHNYLVIIFSTAGLILSMVTFLLYGKLRIRHKQFNGVVYQQLNN